MVSDVPFCGAAGGALYDATGTSLPVRWKLGAPDEVRVIWKSTSEVEGSVTVRATTHPVASESVSFAGVGSKTSLPLASFSRPELPPVIDEGQVVIGAEPPTLAKAAMRAPRNCSLVPSKRS